MICFYWAETMVPRPCANLSNISRWSAMTQHWQDSQVLRQATDPYYKSNPCAYQSDDCLNSDSNTSCSVYSWFSHLDCMQLNCLEYFLFVWRTVTKKMRKTNEQEYILEGKHKNILFLNFDYNGQHPGWYFVPKGLSCIDQGISVLQSLCCWLATASNCSYLGPI